MSEQRADDGPVELYFTSDAAWLLRGSGNVCVEPNLDGMAAIAQSAGVIECTEALPPQLVVVRSQRGARKSENGREDYNGKLPRNMSQDPQLHPKVFYRASQYLCNYIITEVAHNSLVERARAIGANALIEVEVPDWKSKAQVYAAAYARGLLQGQRPLDLLPEGVEPDVADPPRVQRMEVEPTPEDLRMVEEIGQRPRVPNPFLITPLFTRGSPR